VVVTLLYFPHLWMGWEESGFVFWNKVLEVILFNLFGPMVGILTQMELKQRARNQELQTLASMGEAVAFVAHEIKNIVIPVRGFLRLLRQTCPLDGKAESYIEIAQRESARLENIAKNMLTFARQAPIQREPIAVEALLCDACHTLSEEFKEKSVELICNCPEGIGEAYLDSEMIRQAIYQRAPERSSCFPWKGRKG
jgi:Signal transduction histidine kinase